MTKYLQIYYIDVNERLKKIKQSKVNQNGQQKLADTHMGSHRYSKEMLVQKSLGLIQVSERQIANNNHVQIDGGYGDYAMSVFRTKDRISRQNNISRLFSEQHKNKLINSLAINNEEARRQIEQVINKAYEKKQIPPKNNKAAEEQDKKNAAIQKEQQKIKKYINHDDILVHQCVSLHEKKWIEPVIDYHQTPIRLYKNPLPSPKSPLRQKNIRSYMVPKVKHDLLVKSKSYREQRVSLTNIKQMLYFLDNVYVEKNYFINFTYEML